MSSASRLHTAPVTRYQVSSLFYYSGDLIGLLALTGKAAARFEKALISLSLLTEERRKPGRINRDDLQLSFTQSIICGQLVYYNGENHLLAANEIFTGRATEWSSFPVEGNQT